MAGGKKADEDTKRGIGRALNDAFNGTHDGLPVHVAADAVAAEFAALLDQLNDPPPQYQRNA